MILKRFNERTYVHKALAIIQITEYNMMRSGENTFRRKNQKMEDIRE